MLPSNNENVIKSPWINKEAYRYMAGITAGVVSTSAGFPMDVIRVRLLFHKNPFANLGSGFTFVFLVSVGKSGFVWPLQRELQELVTNHSGIENELTIKFISGAIGNVTPGIIFNPLNIIKVRYMEDPNPNKSLHGIVSHMYHNEGFSVFKKGLVATLLRDSIWGMTYFPLQTIVRRNLSKDPSKDFLMNTLACSSAAGLSTLLTSTLDAARLFAQKTTGHYTFWYGLQQATKPTWNNFGGTLFGVMRVSFTTALGHVSFMQLMKWIEGDHQQK